MKSRVLITGADGFLGKNLRFRIEESKNFVAIPWTRSSPIHELAEQVRNVDAVVHLAGVNRTQDIGEFQTGNTEFTSILCDAIRAAGRPVTVLYSSSTQAALDNPYGKSKLNAENLLIELTNNPGCSVSLFRLTNIFGKWSRPNYNSAVATFCHNISRDLPIEIRDPNHTLSLVYVDDVVDMLLSTLSNPKNGLNRPEVTPVYDVTLGDLAEHLRRFRASRKALSIAEVGTGFLRALYSTYVSFLPSDQFSYDVPSYSDPRGRFVEILKTTSSGQFSFFTAAPGVIRGRHYHHTKTEKFMVAKGLARFHFKNLHTGEQSEITVDGSKPQVVDTIPGWIHDIENIGQEELVVFLWANEVFDREKPDTYIK